MKNSNIFLSAIGIISIISVVFSFRVQHRFNGTLMCYTGNSSAPTHKFIFAFYTATDPKGVLLCTIPGSNQYWPTAVSENL